MSMLLVCVGFSLCEARTDFRVNDDGGVTEQNHPRVAVAGDGGFVITWVDKRSGSADVYLQRYSAAANSMSVNRRVNDDTGTAWQAEPAIAVDLSGLYSIVWKDYRNGAYPFDPYVFFQRYDSATLPVGSNRNLTSELPDSLKETPDIALSPWGGGVVVWADYRNQNWDIYGQLIASDGSFVGANFRVNSDVGTAQQHAPRVDYSPDGWFVVTWYDSRLGHDDIFTQRYTPQGSPRGTNLRINSDAGSARQAFPDVAADGAGHFTVVWVDWRNGTYPNNPDIYARKFDTNLVPITGDTKVNRDGTARAQREPTIAADRRGNVAIIWSDSTGTSSWNIVGQMIDVDGVIREANFQANSYGDSAQLQPDVALDGRYRYITWADRRNGNYDVYASTAKYNDPSLVVSPASLRFEMATGGPLPPAQELVVEHAGYNPLTFSVLASHSWISVQPAGGTTPNSVSVSIATDTLSHGTHLGALTFVDLVNHDSSVVISVRLDVTPPALAVTPDSLHFRAFAGLDLVQSAEVTVANTGPGTFGWTATENASWLTLTNYSGASDVSTTVQINAATLIAATYVEPIVIDAGAITNSPDTVVVVVEVFDDQPCIMLQPDSIGIATTTPSTWTGRVAVHNAGAGTLDWRAMSSNTWLHIEPDSGSDDDTIAVSIDPAGLSPGTYVGWVDVTDSSSVTVSERLPFVLEYLAPSSDTIAVQGASIALESVGSLPVIVTLVNSATRVYLPLTYDTSLVTLDSVVFTDALTPPPQATYQIDSSTGTVILNLVCSISDSTFSSGTYPLADLWFTGGSREGTFTVDQPFAGSLVPYLLDPDSTRLYPVVLPGEVEVSSQTAVDPDETDRLPRSFALSQNYPNPFNLGTVIEFSVPVLAEVEIELFNVLGQRVGVLASGPFPAGDHRVEWSGRYDDGRSAPSGVYFCRLKAGSFTAVRKLVLIK